MIFVGLGVQKTPKCPAGYDYTIVYTQCSSYNQPVHQASATDP